MPRIDEPVGDRRPARWMPLWLKLLYTIYVVVLIPIYWLHYGPQNFLWFSDVALLLTAAAMWLQSALLASMLALSITLPELVWNIGFFCRLFTGARLAGLGAYMFDVSEPLYLRGLSLFHVFLPPLLLWMVWRWGYDRRAVVAQTIVGWIVLLLTFLLTDPARNINWAFGPGAVPQQRLAPGVYLLGVLLFLPAAIYLPTHLLLRWLCPTPASARRS